MKPGTKAILEAKLETFPNPYPKRNYEITIVCPEYTALCPITGYPDFGVITIKYIPDEKCLELKSVKLYINKFRDQGMFYEEAVNRILEDMVSICKPRWMEVVGDFNPRGNIKTIVKAEYGKRPE